MPHDLLFFLFATPNQSSESLFCFVVFFSTFLHFWWYFWLNRTTFAEGLSFCIVFRTNFALRRFVDGHDLCDVSVLCALCNSVVRLSTSVFFC